MLRATALRPAVIRVPRPWGRRELRPLFPGSSELAEPIGEVWLTSREAPIEQGPWQGVALNTAWRQMPADWKGHRLAAEADFPLLIKFLFTGAFLSVQVHPDDEWATQLEGPAARGKTEMWYVVQAAPGAEVRVGIPAALTREQFLDAVSRGTVAECLLRWTVQAGDTIFIPAGTFHTGGPGLVLCEIQQYADITYRVFDFHRTGPDGHPRELHLEKAMQVGRFGVQQGGLLSPVELPCTAGQRRLLVSCRYFTAEAWALQQAYARRTRAASMEALVVLSGQGQLEWADASVAVERGQCWLLPASLGPYRLLPSPMLTLLRISAESPESWLEEFPEEHGLRERIARIMFS
jgi:mannose-6-phosphate isomerase